MHGVGPCRSPRPAGAGRVMRATARSASPAARACSSALSAMPFASYQGAARRWSSGTRSGSLRLELGDQQIAEELVDAVPVVPVIDGLEEEVLAERSAASHRAGVGALEHRVAQRRSQPIEDRRAGEERDLLGGRWSSTSERKYSARYGWLPCGADRRSPRPRLHRERREVQPRRPALRPRRSAPRRRLGSSSTPLLAEQLGGLVGIEGQVVRRRARRGDRGRASSARAIAARAREATSRRCCAGSCERDLGDDVERLGVRDRCRRGRWRA